MDIIFGVILGLISSFFLFTLSYYFYLKYFRRSEVPSWVETVLEICWKIVIMIVGFIIWMVRLAFRVFLFLLSQLGVPEREAARNPHRFSGTRLTYKGKNYRVDKDGSIYEDTLMGGKVGKIDKNGHFTIQDGIFQEGRGRISSLTGDVFEKDVFGADKKKAGRKKEWHEA